VSWKLQPHTALPLLLLALLLCEILITEAGTNRKTLVGIFDQLIIQRFPAHQRMAIYARLTDGQGIYKFKLEFVDIGQDRLLSEFEADPIQILDRLRQLR